MTEPHDRERRNPEVKPFYVTIEHVETFAVRVDALDEDSARMIAGMRLRAGTQDLGDYFGETYRAVKAVAI